MLEKLKDLKNDKLLYHKAGLLIGAVAGVAVGFYISDKAEQQEFVPVIVDVIEEANGKENN